MFGSKFVTVCITGNKDCEVEMVAYQVRWFKMFKMGEITISSMHIWFNGILLEEKLDSRYVSYNLLNVIVMQVSNQCMALVNDKIIVPTKVQILYQILRHANICSSRTYSDHPVHILITGCP